VGKSGFVRRFGGRATVWRMAPHRRMTMTTATFLAVNRGVSGTKSSDITVGSSSDAGADLEVRFNQTDANGANCTKKDLVLALHAFERFVNNGAANVGGLNWPFI
jgi:hypothetical protein